MTGLTLKYQGSTGYLDANAYLAVIEWPDQKNYWNLSELEQHVLDSYNVIFASSQSYYELFQAAGISWKKTQKRNPKLDTALVEKKTEDYRLVGCSCSSDCIG